MPDMTAPQPSFIPSSELDTAFQDNEPSVKILRGMLAAANAELNRQFDQNADISNLVHHRARIMDELLNRAWSHCQLARDNDIALVAVGGYGRAELHPGSDIDLLILLKNDTHDRYKPRIEKFLTLLWDTGLYIGHSVRSLSECMQEAMRDITIATNLMEARLLAGSGMLFDEMRRTTGPQYLWPGREFFEAKLKEQTARHHKFHDTAYNLEPNIKEGPGGLRDIQMVGWVAKRHFGAGTLHELVGHGFLTEEEYLTLIEGQDYLWKIRYALHMLAGRREDRLLFDYQRPLAQRFGFRDSGTNLAVEQFMKEYYRTVMTLNRLNEMLLQLFQEAILLVGEPGEPIPINKRFQARKGFIEVSHDRIFQHYPFALLEIFLLLQLHPELKGVRASTIRLIRTHLYLIDDKFRNDLRNRTLFMEIMRQPRSLSHELRRMNRYGVLAAYVAPFGAVVGLMQYDLFHVYTVDEHTLMVIRNLRRYTVPEFVHEHPFCSELIKTIPKPEILHLAAMFHDIAKGRGGDHSELGAEEAAAFCLHHGMSHYDARLVAWLVRHHLIFSGTSQRKDISDPEVIREFAFAVGDETHLNYLYLLTVADICATNDTLWNSWKDALLLELYQSTRRALRAGLENPIDKTEHIAEIQEQARRLLTRQGMDEPEIAQVWRRLDDDYFLRYSADEIVWHTLAISQHPPGDAPLVSIRQQSPRGGTEIFIYTRVDDRLFARTTQTLDKIGLTIVDARIMPSRNGYTLDTYVVLEAAGEAIEHPYRIKEISVNLQRELNNLDQPFAGITRRPSRHLKHFKIPTEINFSTDEHNRRTVMELITTDRPGLLSRVGQALMECGIRLQNAKIATFGARVEDVFFITDKTNRPLSDETQFGCLQESIKKYLEELNAPDSSAG